MQHRIRESRSSAVVSSRPLARRAPVCLASLVACAAGACSSEYPVGNLADQSQQVGLVPDAQEPGATGSADSRLDPLLPPADVTLPVRGHLMTPAGVGDVDGDGYADFALAGFDDTLLVAYVHLRYGGPAPIEAEDQFALAESGARLAFEENSPAIESIAAVGDVDGDGYDDVIVTATVCDALLPGGGAYLFYGGPERVDGAVRIGSVATHLELPLPSAGQPGCRTPTNAPIGLGDIDGDGLDDFMLVAHSTPSEDEPLTVDKPTYTTGYLFYGRHEPLASGTSWLDADATINAEQLFVPHPLGDVTADGRADFALGAELANYHWVPGAVERLSGAVAVTARFAPIECADGQCLAPPVAPAGDVDGDGVDDVLAYETYNRARLFYGAPGLLDGGSLDAQSAAASFADDLALPEQQLLSPAGDRDGDGDADLLSLFYSDPQVLHTDVAFVSGTRTRLDGPQALPIQDAIAARPRGLPFSLVLEHQSYTLPQDRAVRSAINAGDLNGDGADDLLTTSLYVLSSDASGTRVDAPQLHIHYGTPGGVAPAPVR